MMESAIHISGGYALMFFGYRDIAQCLDFRIYPDIALFTDIG